MKVVILAACLLVGCSSQRSHELNRTDLSELLRLTVESVDTTSFLQHNVFVLVDSSGKKFYVVSERNFDAELLKRVQYSTFDVGKRYEMHLRPFTNAALMKPSFSRLEFILLDDHVAVWATDSTSLGAGILNQGLGFASPNLIGTFYVY